NDAHAAAADLAEDAIGTDARANQIFDSGARPRFARGGGSGLLHRVVQQPVSLVLEREQRLDLLAQPGIVVTVAVEKRRSLRRLAGERGAHELVDRPPARGGHAGVCPDVCLAIQSWPPRASRPTVAVDMPSDRAISGVVTPPK